MAVPNPRLWSVGEIPTAAQLNTDIRDPIGFFKRLPAVIVQHGSNVSIPNNTWTLLSWTAADPVDTENIHSTSSNTPRLICVTAGWYYMFAHLRWEFHTDNTGSRAAQIRRNSAGAVGSGQRCCGDLKHSNNFASTTPNRHGQSFTGFQNLGVGDYLECFVWHDQTNIFTTPVASNIYHADTSGAVNVRFGMIWAGP